MVDVTNAADTPGGSFIADAGRLLSGKGSQADLGKITRNPEFYNRLAKLERWQLLPFLFSVKGGPYSLADYPQFKYMYSRKYPANMLYKCGRQIGKCQSINDLCTLSNGTLLPAYMIRAGDSILALDSDYKVIERKVTAVFNNGVQVLLEVTTMTGHIVRVTPNHRLKTLRGYVDAGHLELGDKLASVFNGGLFENRPVLKARIEATAYSIGGNQAKKQTGSISIPDWVFKLSSNDTALFISNIWVTGEFFKSHSRLVTEQLRSLLNKFGIASVLRQNKLFELGIEPGKSLQLFHDNFQAKAAAFPDTVESYSDDTDIKWDPVVSVKQIPAGPTLDFEVEHDHNYVLDGIISHNSTNLSRSEIMDCIQMNNLQVLYVAPLKQQSDRYAQLYLKDAINTCKPAKLLQSSDCDLDEGPIIRSVSHQAFLNGSGIQTMYAKTSADRARGITADEIDYDEIQDQLIDHLHIIAESISNSEWGIQRYCGTAKTTDNTIEFLWQQTSMSEWQVKCLHCGHWNNPIKEGHVLKMIHTSGPVCAKCRGAIDPRDEISGGQGTLVHARPAKAGTFLGVHIPQIFVPAVYKSPVKWSKLIHKVTNLPEAIIYTEILGISHDSGLRLITQEDVDKASTLGTHEEIRATMRGKYRHRILGVDWGGGADITSFTVSAVIGITAEGQIDVLFAKRYAGMGIEDVIIDITRTFRSYECDLIAADFGGGFTNNSILANRGIPVSQVQYVRSNSFLRFTGLNNIQRWMVDRNTALNLVFWAVKFGKIHFPAKGDSGHYTSDLLSPYEHLRELSSGIVSKVFLRNPSIPDDFCHALVFGALMGLQLAGDRMLSIVPETAMEYTGTEFPEGGLTDVGGMLNMFKGKE